MRPLNITKIKLEAFKGPDATLHLGHLNLITGHNGRGKSRIPEAAMFGCMGHTPRGKLDEETAKIAGPRGCAVSMEISNGFSFTRKLDVKSHANSQSLHVGGTKKLKKNEAESLIHQTVGNFAYMWDTSAVLALSPDKRRDLIIELCGAAIGTTEINADETLKRLKILTAKSDKLAGPGTVEEFLAGRHGITDEAEATWEHVKALYDAKIAGPQALAIDEMLEEIRGDLTGPAPEAIAAALINANDNTNLHKRESTSASKSAEDIADTLAELSQKTPAGNVEELTKALADLGGRRDGVIDRKAAQEQRDERIADAQTRHDNLVSRIQTLNDEIERMEADVLGDDRANLLDEVVKDIDNKAGNFEQIFLANAKRDLELEKANVEHTKIARTAQRKVILENIEKARSLRESCHTERRHCMDEIDRLTRDVKACKENIAELKAVKERHAADPLTKIREQVEVLYLEFGGGGWSGVTAILDNILAIIDANQKTDPRLESADEEIADLETKIADAQKKLPEHEKSRDAANDMAAEQVAKVNAFEKRLAEFDAQQIEDNTTALMTKVHEAEKRVAELRQQAKDKRAEAEQIRTSAKNHAEKLATKIAERDRLGAERETLTEQIQTLRDESEFTVAALEEQLADVDAKIADINAKLEAKRRYDSLNEELLKTRERAERRMVAHEMGKIVVAAIKELREELTQKMTAPLVGHMNKLLGPLYDESVARIRLDNTKGKKAVFEFEWFKPDERTGEKRWHALEALSGGQRTLYVTALAYALLMLADPPLKLLLVEAAEIDEANLFALMQAVEGVADGIGNVIIATHVNVAGFASDSEWTLFNMDENVSHQSAAA